MGIYFQAIKVFFLFILRLKLLRELILSPRRENKLLDMLEKTDMLV